MKKIISGIFSMILTASLLSQTFPIMAQDVAPVDIDKSIYEQMLKFDEKYDTNNDGVISEEEFTQIDFLYLSLDNVKDISGLKKAANLRHIDLSGGSITDFSVLKDLEKLRNITISNNPISDISCFKDMTLNFLRLDDTKVSDEDKISLIRATDLELPVGYADYFNLTPSGLLECKLVIEDNEIAGFNDSGAAEINEEFYNRIVAKKAGETTYSVLYNDKVIKTGKIKVTPANVKNPVSDALGIKVKEIETLWKHDNQDELTILTDDGKLYSWTDGKFVLIDSDVKTAYGVYVISADDSHFVLHNDGRLTANGKPVFDEKTKVTEICNNYAITDDGKLWYINVTTKGTEPIQVGKDCESFENFKLVYKKDGTLSLINCITKNFDFEKVEIYDIGKIKAVSVHNYDDFILDDTGKVWALNTKNSYSAPDVKLIAENAVKLGSVVVDGSLKSGVYGTEDGKVYFCESGKEIESAKASDIINYNMEDGMVFDALYRKRDMYPFKCDVTVAGITIMNDDRIYGSCVTYDDDTLYMSCLGKHMAITDVKKSYGAMYDAEANDFSILIVRKDNTLWEYRISADTLTQITKISSEAEQPKDNPKEDKMNVADLTTVIKNMVSGEALTDEQSKKLDLNDDKKINILDVILIKSMLLS